LHNAKKTGGIVSHCGLIMYHESEMQVETEYGKVCWKMNYSKKEEIPMKKKEYRVREDGCYMRDYIINNEGRIVRTCLQHVHDDRQTDDTIGKK